MLKMGTLKLLCFFSTLEDENVQKIASIFLGGYLLVVAATFLKI